MKSPYVLPLADASAALESVGGKGLSLAKMIRAGFPVPGGFHITTGAYRAFVVHNELQRGILAALAGVELSNLASLEAASASIASCFARAKIPAELASEITTAYHALNQQWTIENHQPVAVRSSATAEDLPEASFAGQQETYLNVCGGEAVLEAVKKCWASLWTARAITYRIKNQIGQDDVALAVVVQEMVNAEAAGILFTANPLNGRDDEMVINAAWGLGEAIVGGLVTPDTLVVDKATGKVKKMEVAEKTVMTVAVENGTQEKPLGGRRRKARVLDGAQVAGLASLARRIETFYGAPQDIEWCLAQGTFYIVQSRPVTALPEPELAPPASWKLPKGAYAVLRNNIVELMAEPLSPLFATLGLSAINISLYRLMDESFGMRGIMPDEIIIVVNHYAYNNGSVSAKGFARLMINAGKIMKMMFTGAVERWTEAGRPRYIATVQRWQSKDPRTAPAVELVDGAGQLAEAAIDAYGALVSGVIPAAWITEALFTKLYNRLFWRRGDPPASTYLLGYDSLPIQADKSLYSLAEWARGHPSLVDALERATASQLASGLVENAAPGDVPPSPPAPLPLAGEGGWEEWRRRFQEHLKNFGHTIYDLDFAHPLPADDPAPVLDAFKLYLRGGGANPFTRQQAFEKRREQAVQAMVMRLNGRQLKLFKKTLASAQKYAPLREDGLAEIGLAYPLIRQMLLELGGRLAQRGAIPEAGDIFWLTEDEVRRMAAQLDAGQPVETAAEAAAEAVHLRQREHKAALRLNPPKMLPQMKLFGYDLASLKAKRGRGGKGNVIRGVAASPGTATGAARVLHGPSDFSQMRPGDVLVAPITTPAWTPLFAMASAIVTDVGGPLSHGSIVAREYGIPAVLGTEVATRRIRDGQTITVDGDAGTVTLGAGDR